MRTVSFVEPRHVSFIEDEIPTPGYNEVLIKMKACGICKYDVKCLNIPHTNAAYSARPGHEGVGIIEKVGKGITDLKIGDKVVTISQGGVMAEFYLSNRQSIARIPHDVVQYEQWIAEPVACVVCALRLLNMEPGDDVVVIGSGYMGLLLVQGLPKAFINNLIVTDIDDRRLALAKKFGATSVINAAMENPINAIADITKRKVDLVIEAVGVKGTIEQATTMLRNGGSLCIFSHHAFTEQTPIGDWHLQGLKVMNTTPFMSNDFHKDLVDAVGLMAKGTYLQSELITHVYRFEQAAQAMEESIKYASKMIKSVLVNY